ncbi:hypothetical protein J437_LFUL000139 [Ladona fulva]|uniref:Uncharacterized protein n=1 Tax=Ladona fulva TaxID=123851 RepID=A0A8K0K4E6_LADFU|nr:hypothetical protein J437_LFUL000139 [Ladona fulva]
MASPRTPVSSFLGTAALESLRAENAELRRLVADLASRVERLEASSPRVGSEGSTPKARCAKLTIGKRRAKVIGHVLRHNQYLTNIIGGKVVGKKPRGRRRASFFQNMEKEMDLTTYASLKEASMKLVVVIMSVKHYFLLLEQWQK